MRLATLALAMLLAAMPTSAQDRPAVEVVDGGVLLTDAQAVTVAQRIRRCEAERDYLLDAGVPETVPLWVPAVVGLAAGVAVGVGVSRLGPLTKP